MDILGWDALEGVMAPPNGRGLKSLYFKPLFNFRQQNEQIYLLINS